MNLLFRKSIWRYLFLCGLSNDYWSTIFNISERPYSLCRRFADIHGNVPEERDDPGNFQYSNEVDFQRIVALVDGCKKLEDAVSFLDAAIKSDDLYYYFDSSRHMSTVSYNDNVIEFLKSHEFENDYTLMPQLGVASDAEASWCDAICIIAVSDGDYVALVVVDDWCEFCIARVANDLEELRTTYYPQ